MKRLFTVLLALAIALPLSSRTIEEACSHHIFKHKGLEREYYLYMPDSLSPERPLLVCLHGHGGRAKHENRHLMTLADEHGFAVCYPQGLKDGKDKTSWNVGYPFQQEMKVDDVAFLRKLVRRIQKEHALNPDNAFLTGMSNGGEMCYLIARRDPGLFAGIMSMAGLTLRDMEPLAYKGAVPFMEVHGTRDKVSYWTGDPDNQYGWGAYLGVPAAISYVVAADGCVSYSREELPLTGQHQVVLHKYKDGTPAWKGGPACEVWLYEVQGGGHNWADKSMDTYARMWEFMSTFMHPAGD